MNATSRAILQTVRASDSSLTNDEQIILDRMLHGLSNIQAESQPTVLSVTQKDAAKLLGVSRVTIWRMTKDHVLHPVEILPGTFRYSYREIAALAEGKRLEIV